MSAEKSRHNSYAVMLMGRTGLKRVQVVDDTQAGFFSNFIQPIPCLYFDSGCAKGAYAIQPRLRQFRQCFRIRAACGHHRGEDTPSLRQQFTITNSCMPKVKFFGTISSEYEVCM